MSWNVYLAGEIHSDWRERIAEGTKHAGLEVTFTSPVTDHAASDDVGVAILGEENNGFWKDHKGAGVNAIRTQSLIRQADAMATAETPEQVVGVLRYVLEGKLPASA
jgi:YtoQ family protein